MVVVTEYIKTVFLEIPLGVNKAGFCLEGHNYLRWWLLNSAMYHWIVEQYRLQDIIIGCRLFPEL